MATFTVYNFGTCSHSQDRTITAALAATTMSPHFITQGVGSGGIGTAATWKNPFKKRHQNPGNATRLTGIFGGKGTDECVANSLRAIEDAVVNRNPYSPPITNINLCGWSRGAVNCFKVAHELSKMTQVWGGILARIPIYIFAFDPVPGKNISSRHMWEGLTPGPNVVKGVVIVAQHERRYWFSAALPDKNDPRFVIDTMPGNHAAIVSRQNAKDGVNVGYEINQDRCAKFLQSTGLF